MERFYQTVNNHIIARLLMICCCLYSLILPASSDVTNDSTNIYDEAHPLVYEDAWDLWPYVFLNENGEPDGYNIDLLKMIFKELDIPYIIKLKPTLEAQEDLRNKKSDLMLRMDADFARKNSSYGKSIIQLFTHSIILPKNSRQAVLKISDLPKYKIYVHDGSFSHHYIKENNLTTNIAAYNDMKEAILELSINQDGIILWNTMSLKWLMTKYKIDNLQLKPFELPYGEYKFFSHDLRLLAKLDSVYSKLRANDRLTPIQNKWFYPEKKQSGIPNWIWKLIYVLGVIVIAFLLYYILYKVRERKMTKEIRKRNDRLSIILETSHVSFWTYDIETQIFTIMDKNGKPEKSYTLLEYSLYYHPEDFIRLTDALKQIVDDHVPSISLDIISNDDVNNKEKRAYNITLSVMRRDKDHKPSVIICSKCDITEDIIRHRKVNDTILRYEAIFNTAMIDMVYYDKNGIIYDLNQKSAKSLGMTVEEIREKHFSIKDVLGFEDFNLEEMENLYLTQIFKSPDDNRIMNKLLKRDLLYYELQFIPIRDEKNNLLGIYGTGRNITEMVRSYHLLEKNVLKLQNINEEVTKYINDIDYVLKVGGISMVKYHLDTHTLTIYSEINKEKYALTQTRALALVAEESKNQALRILNKMDNKQTGGIHTELKTVIQQKSRTLCLQFHFIPIYENGDIKEFFGMCRDISEIKAIEDKLAHETLRAQEVEVVKNAFLHNMSHEIRTPLNNVVGFSELFQMEHSEEDEKVFIREIKESSASLLKLINNILFLSRLDAGMITINPKRINFASSFKNKCEEIWISNKKPNVKYLIKESYKQLILELDDVNFFVIVEEIITNAIQNTNSGTVLARYDYIGDQLVVSIEDTGIGISENAIKHIFERFVTGANSGAGLGLSICHELVEYMGGKIQLKSKEGKGTTVWVTMPCKVIEMERLEK